MGFLYKAELTDQQIFYKELKVYQHKQILKCFVGNKINSDILIENLYNIIIENTSLTKKEIQELNYFDLFLLILYIRYTSIGDLIFAEITTDKKIKLQISINKIIDEFKNFNINELLQPTTFKNIQINYTIPTIDSFIQLQNKKAQSNFYLYFLKNIKINNLSFCIKDLTPSDLEIVFNNLPAKVTSQIIKQVTTIVTKLNSFSVLKFLPGLDQTVYFNLNIENFCMLIRLIFGGDLLSLYENIFALCKYGNLTPEYIEQCTPGEYLFFVKKLEEIVKKQKTENAPPSDFTSTPFEDGLS